MATGATVQTSKAARTCRDCDAPIEATRRFCERHRRRRRIATYVRVAHDEAIDAGEDTIASALGRVLDELAS